MTDRLRVTTSDGKYTYLIREDGSTAALRYGEPWIESTALITGNGMTMALAHDLDAEREKTRALTAELVLLKKVCAADHDAQRVSR